MKRPDWLNGDNFTFGFMGVAVLIGTLMIADAMRSASNRYESRNLDGGIVILDRLTGDSWWYNPTNPDPVLLAKPEKETAP